MTLCCGKCKKDKKGSQLLVKYNMMIENGKNIIEDKKYKVIHLMHLFWLFEAFTIVYAEYVLFLF